MHWFWRMLTPNSVTLMITELFRKSEHAQDMRVGGHVSESGPTWV